MFNKWVVLLLLLTAGCSPATPVGQPPSGLAPTIPASPTLAAMPSETIPATPSAAALTPTTPVSTVAASPSAPATGTNITPTPLSRAGWKTYVNAQWHLAMDYPPNWSVQQSASAVSFVSPQGPQIQLSPVATDGQSPEEFLNGRELPNTRCTFRMNSYGVQARVCLDTISQSYTAEFILKPAQGPEQLFSLSTGPRKLFDLPVFDAMLASVRPAS